MSNTPCLPKSPMSLFTLLTNHYVDYYRDPMFVINLADLGNETLFERSWSDEMVQFLVAIEKIG